MYVISICMFLWGVAILELDKGLDQAPYACSKTHPIAIIGPCHTT